MACSRVNFTFTFTVSNSVLLRQNNSNFCNHSFSVPFSEKFYVKIEQHYHECEREVRIG
jgi:hypothetical protein